MKKKFDAVKFQRAARKRLSRKYAANPRAFVRELRRKHGQPMEQEVSTGHG